MAPKKPAEKKPAGSPAPAPATERAFSVSTKGASALGVLAAFAIAVLGNVAISRNYKRWDLTSSKLYTLSEPTKTTLHGLTETVQINVLLSASDGLSTSVRHLLQAYNAETSKLELRFLDPDRSPAEFMAFKQKYNLVAGRTEDGRIVSEASIVVVKGDKRWFLTSNDLVDSSEADEGRSRPRLEQGITLAIRNVLGGERVKVCFAKGHGELGADAPGARGLGELKHRLESNNTDIGIVDHASTEVVAEPWKGCSLAFVAGSLQPWSAKDAEKLGRYLETGGSVALFLNPIPDTDKKRVVPSGLEPVALKGGIELRSDIVFEKAKDLKLPNGLGETFFGTPKQHAITKAIFEDKTGSSRMLFVLAQSLGKSGSSSVQPAELVVSSPESFGMADFFSYKDDGPPEKRPGDRDGPLTLAMAAELPRPPGGTSPHGPRIVVVGTAALTQGQVWEEPAIRGGAAFVESAISWLTAKPQIVDIPSKPAQNVGQRLTEESLSQVRTYVIIYIPTAAALVGLAVFLRRRSTERRRDAGAQTKKPRV